jgi:predicted phosphodiesterase
LQLSIDGKTYWFVGDPHAGRDFRNGTPLNRRGEREAQQMQKLRDELATECDVNVTVGDVFDKPFVPLPVINEVAQAYLAAARERPKTLFVVMAGNHDLSRQLNIRGAFDILELAIGWVENIMVLRKPTQLGRVAFFPWEWDKTTLEQLEGIDEVYAAVGHYDLMDFGGDTSHVAPTQQLVDLGAELIISGHYHLEGEYEVAGHKVFCTGSLEPYTHAEDPNGTMYLTLTADEAQARDDLHDKCVRILLEPGEDLPEIDCLQLTYKRVDSEHEEVMGIEVGIGAFNLNETLTDEFRENEVPEPVQSFIKERVGAFG